MPKPTVEEEQDVLLSCRYGDIDDVRLFVEKYGAKALESIRDASQNTILHMIAANGHDDILEYLLPSLPLSLFSAQNASGSTPLHWAALNAHLPIIKRLVEFPGGPRLDLIDIKNSAGRTPVGEAELANWDEGAAWLVSVMNLENAPAATESSAPVEENEGGGDDAEEENDEPLEIEVSVEDAQGQISRMTIKTDGKEGTSVVPSSTIAPSSPPKVS